MCSFVNLSCIKECFTSHKHPSQYQHKKMIRSGTLSKKKKSKFHGIAYVCSEKISDNIHISWENQSVGLCILPAIIRKYTYHSLIIHIHCNIYIYIYVFAMAFWCWPSVVLYTVLRVFFVVFISDVQLFCTRDTLLSLGNASRGKFGSLFLEESQLRQIRDPQHSL